MGRSCCRRCKCEDDNDDAVLVALVVVAVVDFTAAAGAAVGITGPVTLLPIVDIANIQIIHKANAYDCPLLLKIGLSNLTIRTSIKMKKSGFMHFLAMFCLSIIMDAPRMFFFIRRS